MSNSQRLWTPKSPMTETQRAALTVEALRTQPMDAGLLRMLMAKKFHKLIFVDPPAARSAMQMSVDHAPELYQIAQNNPMKEWPGQLVASEAILRLLDLIDWKLENRQGERPPTPEPISFREILEQM